MPQRNRKAQYLVSFAVCLASVSAGVSMSWTTPVLPKLSDDETNIHVSKDQISWIASLNTPGFMAGSLAASFVSDKFGRRVAILSSALPAVLGTILVLIFSNVWVLYVMRVLSGMGNGVVTTVATIYLAEISDKDIRGALTLSSRFMFNLGNFLVIAVGPFVSFYTLNYMLLALPTVYFIACWFIPETPYHSLKEGKVEQARKNLKLLKNYSSETELDEELSLIRQDVRKETLRSGSIKELFTGKQYRRALVIVAGIKITQALSGYLVIQQYLGLIIKDTKMQIDVSTALIIFGAVRFISAVMSSMLSDRVGRRPLLVYSYIGTGLSLGIVGAYFFCFEILLVSEERIAPYGIIAFIGMVLSIILSTLGFSSLIYILPAELFPLNVKSVAMTSTNIFGSIANFAVVKVYQQVKDWIGLFGVFTFFSSMGLAGGIFSYLFVAETKGKSLREILVMMQGPNYAETTEKLNKETGATDADVTGKATELK